MTEEKGGPGDSRPANRAAFAALISAVAASAAILVSVFTFYATSNQALQAQFADRYTRAVAQLGEPAVDVRVGGIFALERLGIDSPRDQPTVIAVLSAYVRNHLPFADSACLAIDADARRAGFPPLLPSDVAIAIDVLARRDRDNDNGAIANLAGVCLPGSIILRGRDLTRFDLGFANLDDATLQGTVFRGDSLVGTVLVRAELQGADFTAANVDRAYLVGARNANLAGAIGTPSAPP